MFCSEDGKDSFFTCEYFSHLETRELQRKVKNEAEVSAAAEISRKISRKSASGCMCVYGGNSKSLCLCGGVLSCRLGCDSTSKPARKNKKQNKLRVERVEPKSLRISCRLFSSKSVNKYS